jgi:hypothetical protein
MGDVNHPEHYGGDVEYEAIKVIEDWGFGYGFCMGSAMKYVIRAGNKPFEKTEKDFGKAIWYLDRASLLVPDKAPMIFRLTPGRTSDYHNLKDDRRECLKAISRRDPEEALRMIGTTASRL